MKRIVPEAEHFYIYYFSCVLYLFRRTSSYSEKQQCQNKGKHYHLPPVSVWVGEISWNLEMTKITKTTRGNQVKVASGHKPPNSKDLYLLKQNMCYIFFVAFVNPLSLLWIPRCNPISVATGVKQGLGNCLPQSSLHYCPENQPLPLPSLSFLLPPSCTPRSSSNSH